MTIDDAARFATLMDTVAEGFSAPASELKKLAYFDALADLEYGDVARAMRGLLRTAKFFPKPVEIREVILGDVAGLIEAEWIAMHTAMHIVGAYRTLICDNPALAQTIVTVFGSWPEACRADFSPEMWSSKRKEFDRVYRIYAGDKATHPVVLKGLAQVNNEHNADWSKFTHCGALAGRRARLLEPAEAQARLGGTRLLEAAIEPDRELSSEEAITALQAAINQVVQEKGLR